MKQIHSLVPSVVFGAVLTVTGAHATDRPDVGSGFFDPTDRRGSSANDPDPGDTGSRGTDPDPDRERERPGAGDAPVGDVVPPEGGFKDPADLDQDGMGNDLDPDDRDFER
jgi:hypothetical protein